jgi:imidazoleglycerol-phosphate dehydratase
MSRKAELERSTKETRVKVVLDLDGTGVHEIDTGIGFLDHMLAQLSAHGLFDLKIEALGDTHIDLHHTVEDVGITLGTVFSEALGLREGINRYGYGVVPMDEALATVVVDLSGRAHLTYEDTLSFGKVGTMDTELFREFFEAFVRASKFTLHVKASEGRNAHHIIEAIFKAFARALRQATEKDPRREGVPSTKGNL